ncbi:serine/threonine protein kinase [Myxococcus sp. CA056]|uniref:protein kinase domain-containing protein n=1 Tax=Myxococcus sp. CA056 TaxID=2741740 RepID=UPI00157AD8FF|nr:serine/threonine protein kinase [Myxococcus sp. CA056]
MAEPTPQQFGKYVLLSKIAAGGMAVTYRARMTGAAGVTKPCVIKQILPHFVDDTDFVEMFIGEARLVASMSHSNIAQVFDFGEVDGQYFIAMELVQGQPLSKVLRRAARAGMTCFPEALALHVGSKLCDGLDYAHRHVGEDNVEMGLVHRDVSPDNVLISYEGEIKVIDFGIAKATSAVEAKTSPGTLKGKYPYFSPEQAQGRQDLDARTDVYAAGVVLYEMVCGKRPYEGEFVTVLPRILTGDCLPPSANNPSVSPDLETVISHAMAMERESRYQTAKELSEALVELLYRDNPRFTPALLSQLMAYLFAEELIAEGRKAEVSTAFKEQISQWQLGTVEPSAGRARPLSSGSGQVGSSPRASSPGLRSKPGSDSGAKPPSDGARRPAGSSPGMRKVTSAGSIRRATNTGMPRVESTGAGRRPVTSERPGPPVPELPEEPDTDSSDIIKTMMPTVVPAALATLAAPLDTPVETPAVTGQSMTTQPAGVSSVARTYTGTGYRTSVDEAREALAREEAERVAKQQKAVKQMTLYVFGSAIVMLFIALFYHFVIKSDAPDTSASNSATLWVTSKPAGAKVKLNGRDIAGKTPLMVEGVLVGEANTLVLTLPGHLAWTRRFTPTSMMMEPMNAELQLLATPPPTDAPPVVAAPVEAKPVDPKPVGEAQPVVATAPDDGGIPVKVDPVVVAATATGTTTDDDEDPQPLVDPKEPSAALRELHEVDYPTRLLVLRPMYNAAPIPEYATATIDLNPGTSYSVWTQGTASLAEGRGTASGTLVYFAEGDGPVDGSFGLLSASTRTIKNARKLHVFAVDDNGPEDNTGSIRVVIRQSAYVPPRSLAFEAKEHAVQLKPEHQVVLRGLNPRSTYLFTVRDDFAELRSGANGRVRQVLCIERGTSPSSVRTSHRMLETGKRYQVTDTEDLRCFFPDSKRSDNQGALEVDIVDATTLSRKERAAVLRGSRRSER